jgi:hypothetical protein
MWSGFILLISTPPMIQLSEAKITNLSLAYLELNYAYLEPKYHTTIGIQLVCYARSRMTTPFLSSHGCHQHSQ